MEVEPNTAFTLSEDGPPGYAPQGWQCEAASGGFTQSGSTVTVEPSADVTCTAINTFTGGWLTLVKEVENSTQPATNWTLSATGTGAAAGAELAGPTGSPDVTTVPVPAGDYTLAESGAGGYLTDGFVCDGAAPGYSVTVDAGEDVTCTITNTRDPDVTQLTLVKEVDNSGGGPLARTAWGLSARHENGQVIAGRTGLSPITYRIVEPGTFTLAEQGLAPGTPDQFARYHAGEWSCVDASGAELEVSGAQVDVPEGAQVTCTIENTWTGATLSFRKQVINVPFGSHGPEAWQLAVSPAGGGAPVAAGDGDDGIIDVPVEPGEYRLEELAGPDGYERVRFQCFGDADGDPADELVTVPAGTHVDCTVTNRSISPTLTLRKALDNTGGGTAEVADFTLLARGPGNATIAGPSGDPAVSTVELPPGEYVFREDGPPVTRGTGSASAASPGTTRRRSL